MGGRIREDGSYESLDLAWVEVGSEVVISTDQGSHTLIKGNHSEHAGALEGWARLRGEAALGITTLVLLNPNKGGGTSFLTQRVVLETGIEVGALDPLSEHPNVIRSLGIVANIAYRSPEDRASSSLVNDGIDSDIVIA
ncbi:MAG: hypothetical protein JWP06_119 [Candidatus Saccharibacteria bacterium]|nr:hypothetical protein [Candidatus Saccharibacteria bacterium]